MWKKKSVKRKELSPFGRNPRLNRITKKDAALLARKPKPLSIRIPVVRPTEKQLREAIEEVSCARCYTAVSVTPGCEFEGLCYNCEIEILKAERAHLAKLLDRWLNYMRRFQPDPEFTDETRIALGQLPPRDGMTSDVG